jgi:4-amino-4-deoxy-L-arabinose transferase-like glycosyltransferase
LLFGLVVFAFARDLTGPVGGLVALALYTFSPDVIAHGSLATLDVPAAGFLLTAAWLLWRARDRPRRYLPLAGLALGAALATKANTLVVLPVLLPLAVVAVWRSGRSRRRFAVGLLAAAGVALIAVAVVWATYLAVDPRLRWTTPADIPDVGGLRGILIDWLPVPATYTDGMRVQFGFEDTTYGGFLFGHAYEGSRWYYLPAALLVKTPLGLLVLWAAGSVTTLTLPRLRPAAPHLLLPPLVLGVAALFGSRDYGTRYVIFVPLFLAVAAAGLVLLRPRWAHAATAALVLFVAVSSIRTFPYYLPYSNEAFGGPAHTSEYLHDSNVDWGQDLGRLADRLRERYPGEPVWLVYKGSGVPAWYGISWTDPLRVPAGRVRGLLVVSDSRVARPGKRLRDLIETSEPIDSVGHSITIYRRQR